MRFLFRLYLNLHAYVKRFAGNGKHDGLVVTERGRSWSNAIGQRKTRNKELGVLRAQHTWSSTASLLQCH